MNYLILIILTIFKSCLSKSILIENIENCTNYTISGQELGLTYSFSSNTSILYFENESSKDQFISKCTSPLSNCTISANKKTSTIPIAFPKNQPLNLTFKMVLSKGADRRCDGVIGLGLQPLTLLESTGLIKSKKVSLGFSNESNILKIGGDLISQYQGKILTFPLLTSQGLPKIQYSELWDKKGKFLDCSLTFDPYTNDFMTISSEDSALFISKLRSAFNWECSTKEGLISCDISHDNNLPDVFGLKLGTQYLSMQRFHFLFEKDKFMINEKKCLLTVSYASEIPSGNIFVGNQFLMYFSVTIDYEEGILSLVQFKHEFLQEFIEIMKREFSFLFKLMMNLATVVLILLTFIKVFSTILVSEPTKVNYAIVSSKESNIILQQNTIENDEDSNFQLTKPKAKEIPKETPKPSTSFKVEKEAEIRRYNEELLHDEEGI